MKKSIEEILQATGFVKKSVCHCGGFETYVYRKDEFEIQWRIYGKKFLIKKNKRAIHGWDKIQNFPIQFDKHVAFQK